MAGASQKSGLQKAGGCTGLLFLCILLFFVGLGIVISAVTLTSYYLVPKKETETATATATTTATTVTTAAKPAS